MIQTATQLKAKVRNLSGGDSKKALYFTSKKRETLGLLELGSGILDGINNSSSMMHDWNNFREGNYFVGDLTWTTVVESTTNLYNLCK